MTAKETLLRKIQICDFTLLDVCLYLDTHPKDNDALTFFNKHTKMRNEFACEYVKLYGPLTKNDNQSETNWEWVSSPWPWERKEQVK